MTKIYPLSARTLSGAAGLAVVAAILLPVSAAAQAHSLAGGAAAFRQGGSSSAATTSQVVTVATTATGQAVQAAATASAAQASLAKSLAAFQGLQEAQAAANAAALANAANNLGTPQNPINGLGVGGLNPVGGATPLTTGPSIQLVDLSNNGKNQLVLSNGGSVALPKGTSGSDQVSITGAGSVTTTSGNVTASAGSLSTTTGGTLAATKGGTISLTAGSATLSTPTGATITSNVAGSYTSGGSTVNFAANQVVPIPAGATVSFSGSSAATVNVAGAATVKLSGAGTLALSSASAGAGGIVSTNSGTTAFTNAVITSEPAGTTINLTGSGDIAFNGAGTDVLPVILEPQLNPTTLVAAPPAFTTTGNVIQTTGYTVPSSWTLGPNGALSQSFNASTGQYIDTITQTQQQALLYWTSFNIGKNTTLDFDQSAGGASVGDWVAINRILDPSLSPSQILGSIEAPGQVYVINQNGILFTGSAQINTHALVASTLPINTNLVDSGLLNNPQGQYLFTSELIPSVNGSESYDPNNDFSVLSNGQEQPNTLPNVASGNITVEEGASFLSPGSPEGVGGKIALIAPTVTNNGEISAPDGQIILAAGQQVGFDAHPSADPSLRGLDVAVGAVTGTETATNGSTGLIYAPEADVTMTGPTIVQNGAIESLTSVALNGRIDLLAMSGLAADPGNSFLFDASQNGVAVGGSIELGPSSLTEILPDYSSTSTEVGNALALPSQVYVEGASFHMDGGAQLIAPNATTTFGLGILNTPIAAAAGESTTPLPEDTGEAGQGGAVSFVQPGVGVNYLSVPGSVALDAGANIDVSGSSDVQASVAENIVAVQLTDAVLENSPLQRVGVLHGQTVDVDITQTGTNSDGSTWVGSPIGDLSGYAGLVEHTVGELTVSGGSVNFNTNGSVNLGAGSTVNVSGGSIDYQGAEVATTNLVSASGQIVNIAQADPNQEYSGIYTGYTSTSAKWGVTENFLRSVQSSQRYDPGYVEGGNGGSLTINASSVALGGSLYGNTTQGIRQQITPPSHSTFSLSFQSATEGNDPPPVNVVIQPSSDPASSDPNTVDLSPNLFGVDGFSDAVIDTGTGRITVAADAVISAGPGGSLSFTAANVEVDGQIYVPSGSVSLTALPETPSNLSAGVPAPYDPSIGNVYVGVAGPGAIIATTGLTFDELSGAILPLPFSVNGGRVNISGAATTISAGSSIDASGGIARSSSGALYEGTGGKISITGLFNSSKNEADGQLVIEGNLSAYGIGKGGSLTLKAPAVVVGDGPAASFPADAVPLMLSSSFFSEGGFSSISLVGSAGVQIVAGTTIAPVLTEEVANATTGQLGVNLVSSSQLPAFPAAPVNLSFSASGAANNPIATLSLGAGASIAVGPAGAVSLSGQLTDILGQVSAPGGTITVSGDSTQQLTGEVNSGAPEVSVYLGPQAVLSVSGEEISASQVAGSKIYNTGEVLAGGTIAITGNIVGDPNSSLLADGAVGALDVPVQSTVGVLQPSGLAKTASPYVYETVASNGGSITLNGLDELYFEGSLSAKAGNPTSLGGTLTVGSGVVPTLGQPPNVGNPELFISQDGTYPAATVTLGEPLPGGAQTGGGFFTVDQFYGGKENDGNFSSLILKGNVEFANGTAADPIDITANQQVQIIPDSQNGTIFADGSNEQISISAPYIAIGATTLTIGAQSVSPDAPSYVSFTAGSNTLAASPVPGLADPTFGAASLSLQATDLIDVGFLSMQNFGTTNLSVPTGDIRGGGLFYAAGNINLTAGQIYTPTAATFTVAAFGSDNSINGGTIDIFGGVTRPLPLSAGGTINVYATTINQDGTIEAPFGMINLGALVDPTTGLTPVLPSIDYVPNPATGAYQSQTVVTQYAPATQSLTLGSASVTSVSGVSSTEVLDLPYGTIENGTQWIAPNGQDITAGGLPAEAIHLLATNIEDAKGSLVNLTGGGDLFAYGFNPGVGGTNDILNVYKYANGQVQETSSNVSIPSTSFAILPSYGINYAPIDLTIDSSGNFPYANAALTSQIGNDIYLAGGDGLAAGTYTILPARDALIPGAYLVTPLGSTPSGTSRNPDGSVDMAGYVYNTLNSSQQIVPNVTGFEVDSSAVVDARAPYTISSANTFLSAGATSNNQPVPRLPMDAGQLVFDATAGLDIQGQLSGGAGVGGQGSIVDIGSSDDIYIVSNTGDAPTLTIPTGVNPANYVYLTLSAEQLDQFGAGSLLIGGTRSSSSSTTSIDVLTNAIYVENDSTTPLSGSGIILASQKTLDLAAGSDIEQTGGATTGRQDLTIGNASLLGSGDGTLLRVSGDAQAQFTRLGVDTSDTSAQLTMGAGATVNGVAVTLDSSSGASISNQANLDANGKGQSLVLSSGAISLQVNPNSSVASAPGLVLSSNIVQSLSTLVQGLTLSSYSTINLYGSGSIGALDAGGKPLTRSLTLNAAGIFGYDTEGGTVTINAQNVTLGNPGNDPLPTSTPGLVGGGTLAFNAITVNLLPNVLTIDGYANVQLAASDDMLVSGNGALNTQGALDLVTGEIAGATDANYTFDAQGGALTLTKPTSTGSVTVADGFGATLAFEGSSVTLASKISASSGTITAVATTGGVEVQSGGDLDVSGQAVQFGSAVGYTSGGQVNLTSQGGDVLVDTGALINVSAPAGGGNAGTVVVSAPTGGATFADGSLSGTGGSGGSFTATLGQAVTLSSLTSPLTDGGFESMAFDVLNGSVTVDGAVGAKLGQAGVSSFSLTTEAGAITVENTINASGLTGGTIDLFADQGVTLTGNAVLSVSGQQFDAAGNGGTIDIETRGDGGGLLNLEANSQLVLGVGKAGSIVAGGTVHLRAPQTLGGTLLGVNSAAIADGVAMDPIGSTITNAGSVAVEGYRIYNPAGGSIDSVKGQVTTDVANFPTSTIAKQLGIVGNPLYQIEPGVEIINPTGDLTLANTWDLSTLRTAAGAPGVLTIRAAGNLIFNGSLTDGFTFNASDAENVATSPYTWDLMPVGSQSWSYRLVAGAQFGSSNTSPANFGNVQSLTALGLDTSSLYDSATPAGSLLLGQVIPYNFNYKTKTAATAATYAQLIRTGTGDITIDAGGSVDLMNTLASIYTAGQLAPTIPGFDLPTGTSDAKYETHVYGANLSPAPQYTAQYTENGGSITINAQQDIVHLTQDSNGNVVLDTSWQFPTNWLYRRGATSSTDVFDATMLNSSEVASTTWWVDFSNFFEGIGALGGGNVSLNAGGNIVNVDAVVPTNARMPFADASGNPIADKASNLVELGGGNLSVVAGGAIEGGTYYVERGSGTIDAATITSADDAARISAEDASLGTDTPLPLTLFVGDSSFSVNATNGVTIGSTVNPFLLPQGIGNNFNNESFFSTYGVNSSVSLASLLGTITIQGSEYGGNSLPGSLYNAYLSNASPGGLRINFATESSLTGTPWTLTLDPTDVHSGGFDNVTNYSTFYALSPPIFSATAFSGDIQYDSDQLLSPSPAGTLQLMAAGKVDGAFTLASIGNVITATIAVLNDDPGQLPNVTNPFGLGQSTADPASNPSIGASLAAVSSDLGETPSYQDLSYTQLQSLNTPGLLHNNTTTPPVQIDTINGDIGDLTLISPERVDISSGLDIQDVSFYIQNNSPYDVSVVSANRDITLYDPNSAGLIDLGAADSFFAAFGDIQIGGPGTLEVLAGRNLNLGEGVPPNSVNFPGTGLGITSIGQSRDPYLPFGGATILAAAGIGQTSGIGSNPQAVNYNGYTDAQGVYHPGFVQDYLDYTNTAASGETSIYLPDLGSLLGASGATDQQIWDIFAGTPDASLSAPELKIQASLTPAARDALATTIFYDVLRDAGRNHNKPGSLDYGSYASGYDVIKTLFPNAGNYQGDITLTSREFKTTNGGDINLLVPGGGIDVGLNNLGTQAVDQGILTVDGGNISIFANNDVSIGTSRIFTLHGGNIIIWSSAGSIDAGASSRTVQSAPPTQVLVDSQSANVQTDLAGLATGGGIGVLETVVGAPPGDVDLIAPVGTVNAGDAGIRASGNVNVAAAQVLNANNIQAGGSKTGVPTTTSANVGLAVSAANAAGSSENAASNAANQQQNNASQQGDLPSIISVEVIGYGDDDDSASTESPSDRKSSGATYLAARPDSGASKF